MGIWTSFPAGAAPYANFLSVTATFQVENKRDRSVVKKQRKPFKYQRGNWIRVRGYTDSKFFYGQLQLLGKGKVAGYLYHPKADPLYVYGEITQSGVIQAFDNKGFLYRLLIDQAL